MVMTFRKSIAWMAFLVLLAPLALGLTINSITTSGPTGSVTTGTDVTIPVTLISDSTGSANQISLTGTGQTTGTSLTITDPASGSFTGTSLTSSGTTVNFVVSAGIADTYDYSVTGTYSSGSASSTTTTLKVVDPSALSISGTVNSTTNTVGNRIAVTVTLSNPSATQNVTTSYALTFQDSSAFTVVSGDSTSGTITLEPSGTNTFSYVLNAAAATTNTQVRFGVGSNGAAFAQSMTTTAAPSTGSTPPSSGGSASTPTPTVAPTASAAPTSQPVLIPKPKETTGQNEPVIASKSKEISTSSAVTGSFGENSATFQFAYTAPVGGFSGKLTDELPFECADYQAGLIVITPPPSDVQCGSVIATWDVALAPGETFVANIEVAKSVDQSVINEFKAPTLAARTSSAPSAAPQTPATASEEPAAAPAPAGADNTLLYIVGALVVLGLLYYFVAMRKK